MKSEIADVPLHAHVESGVSVAKHVPKYERFSKTISIGKRPMAVQPPDGAEGSEVIIRKEGSHGPSNFVGRPERDPYVTAEILQGAVANYPLHFDRPPKYSSSPT